MGNLERVRVIGSGDMSRGNVSLDDKQRWMREKHSVCAGVPMPAAQPSVAMSAFAERHFSVAEVASLWNLSPDAIRDLFHDEPGVLVLGEQGSRHARRYTTLRIPESVLQRVHRRLSRV